MVRIKISPAWIQFLGTLATAVAAPELGLIPAAVAAYLRLAQQLIALPGTTDEDVAALTAKVQKMVDENRGPTADEISELEATITSQSAAIQALRPHGSPIGL